jgi:hypothetical protein
MKKTILHILLLSFSLLSLHIHAENDSDIFGHSSSQSANEEICEFCKFNSDKIFAEFPDNSVEINFKNVSYQRYLASYITQNSSCFQNKSPPTA